MCFYELSWNNELVAAGMPTTVTSVVAAFHLQIFQISLIFKLISHRP
jgi:hypothetical protein